MRGSILLAATAWLIAWTPIRAQVVDVWPGVAPGSERWKQQERTIEGTPVGTVVMNVVTPTITAYLPERSRATGAGVIVAPGGGFVALAISLEATDLAKWLQQRGVAAFVLKYRTIEKKEGGIPQMDMDTAGRYGIADGIQALKVVRAHAKEWGLERDRIGMIGFSAGAMVTSAAMLQRDRALRPSFAALIYGAPFGKMPAIPAGLPPVFMAWAKDDPVALAPVVKFHDALVAAGQPPETHVYAKGGHGFGMKKQGADSDHWIDDYARWLRAHGVIRGQSRQTLTPTTGVVPHPRISVSPHPRR
jgi:acetyl esterase/lipase